VTRCLLATVAVLFAGYPQMATSDATAGPRVAERPMPDAERGRYVATLADCAACHTDPGHEPYAGGRALQTPFGTLLTPNLTPDRETGIGAWSDEAFLNALQRGIGRQGEHLYPAMPYAYYTRMAREDVLALRAFLRTLPPVRHGVVANQLPFPFRIRAGIALWNTLYFRPGVFTRVPEQSEQWNRGAYLVEGPGHCGACHTPKTALGGEKWQSALQGGALQGWFSPNLTPDRRTGLGEWSDSDIAAYLKVGHNRVSAATGPMAEVIGESTSHWADADLNAIAAYLTSRQPAAQGAPSASLPSQAVMRAGAAIYVDACSACHAPAGEGVADLFPALKASPIVQSRDPTTVVRVVLHGAQNVATEGAPTGPSMPSFQWKLTDHQTAAVTTYIRNSWGNAASPVPESVVARVRSAEPVH
jgi:mono/diheme cytochrome c family protein